MAPRLDSLIRGVVEKLQFREETDFYVTNNPELNACSISRLEEDQAHIINLNSGLVERLDDDELKFVVGHEIGHLISKNAGIMKLVQFIFPDPMRTPLLITHRITLWKKTVRTDCGPFWIYSEPPP
ncbi:MAG: M48 family metalloprotease [Acidobacteriota bacterium]